MDWGLRGSQRGIDMVGTGRGGGGFTFHLKGMMSGGVQRWYGGAAPRGPDVNTRPFSKAV